MGSVATVWLTASWLTKPQLIFVSTPLAQSRPLRDRGFGSATAWSRFKPQFVETGLNQGQNWLEPASASDEYTMNRALDASTHSSVGSSPCP